MANNDIFKLKPSDWDKVRYIRLTKKASYSEQQLSPGDEKETNSLPENSLKFYSLGFYDSIECIRPRSEEELNHKNHFLISSPYIKNECTTKVEQWFALLPLNKGFLYFSETQKEKNKDTDRVKDVLFCDEQHQEELPFLGIVLISLSDYLQDFKNALKNYLSLLDNFFGLLQKKSKNNFSYIAQIYYTLNCADLCVVIRTDSLHIINACNSGFNNFAEYGGYNINTTVLFSIQVNSDKKTFNLEKHEEKNQKIKFIIRSNEAYKENTDSANITSYGVNGIGKYVTEFSYKEYVQLLPDVIKYKLFGTYDIEGVDKYVKSICHEREWFETVSSVDHICELYKATEVPEVDKKELDRRDQIAEYKQKVICIWIKAVYEKISEIEEYCKEKFSSINERYTYKDSFEREFRAIGDLIRTYSDLWYQSASESGLVFYAQIWICLMGIKDSLECINGNINIDLKEKEFNRLIYTIHKLVYDLNGYNKQFQFLNQDSVNYPSYEIQSKVNAEKYMSAYCSFLHEFFAVYYENKENDLKIVQSFPMALLDISQHKIIANVFFSPIYKNNKKEGNHEKRSLFSVHIPSGEYFSDVWTVIPLLMHEVSHTHNYGDVKKRNEALINSVDNYFSRKIASELLGQLAPSFSGSYNNLMKEALYEKIDLTIKSIRKEYENRFFFNIPLEKIGFEDLESRLLNFYLIIFGKRDVSKNKNYHPFLTWKSDICKCVDFVLSIFNDEFLRFFTPEIISPCLGEEVYYFLYVIFKIFHEECDIKLLYVLRKRVVIGNSLNQILINTAYYLFVTEFFDDSTIKLTDNKIIKKLDEFKSYNVTLCISAVCMKAIGVINKKYINKIRFDSLFEAKILNEKLLFRLDEQTIQEYVESLENANKYLNDHMDLTLFNKTIVKSLLTECYEVVCATEAINDFLVNKELRDSNIRKDYISLFSENLHKNCFDIVKSDSRNKMFYFSKSNRKYITELGLLSGDSKRLQEVYTYAILNLNERNIREAIEDRFAFFKEVYADCGMCSAMNFDAFGYCMFNIYIHDLVGDLDSQRIESSFLSDRMCNIIAIYFDSTISDGDEQRKKLYKKLFDIEMIRQICDYWKKKENIDICDVDILNQVIRYIEDPQYGWSEKNFTNDREIFSNYKFIAWRECVLNELISMIDKYYITNVLSEKDLIIRRYLISLKELIDIFEKEDTFKNISKTPFNNYFKYLYNEMRKTDVIKNTYSNTFIKQMSAFYNMDYSKTGSENKLEWYCNIYTKNFVEHCNFIFDNYCNYRNAYYNVINKCIFKNGDLEISKWYDVLDEYYVNKNKRDNG